MRRPALLVALGVGLAAALALGWVIGASRRPEASAPPAAASPAARYRCPMHAQIVSDRPGRCPICNMELVPVATASGTTALDDAGRKLVGARTVTVENAPFVRRIRTVGRVTFDETRMKHIHTKVQGWIEHLHAGAEGDPVRQGQALLTLYSPELLASQEEYLVALDNRARAQSSTIPEVVTDADRLVVSARRRLLLQDVTEEQIAELERTRRAERIVTLYSPVAGIITARRVSHGERVESATSLLDIADLSTVWVLADLYESDLPFVGDGQPAEIALGALPGRTFRAKVQLLSPTVSPQTRTVTARLSVDNRDLALKPGMFADVTFASDLGARLSIPKDAVVRSGERNVVFVSPEEGVFEPREVKLGVELTDRWEVLSGLTAGERIVVSANFLLDCGIEAALDDRRRSMTERIIAWSARNKFFVLVLTAVAVAFAFEAMKRVPLDAIPDLSDTQVIIYSRWDRSPDIMEDQVTYPVVSSLLGAPKVKAVRGISDFGYSFIYVIFEDGTDLYWARSRVLEYLSKITPRLPEGVRTEIGPDASGVGWVYQYALVDTSGTHDLASLRSFQDWYLKTWLQSVPGVAEVASIGGFPEAVPDPGRPGADAGVRHPDRPGARGGAGRERRGRRAAHRDGRRRVHGAGGAATPARCATSSRSSSAATRTARPSPCATSPP